VLPRATKAARRLARHPRRARVMPVEVVQVEASNLLARHSQKRKAITENVDSIFIQADSIA